MATHKGRSPNYPILGLEEAIKRVRVLYDKERKAQIRREVAVSAWGYKALSGSALRTLSSVKQYGLIEGSGSSVRASNLAVMILHGNQESRQIAIKQAALKPRLFMELLTEDFSDGLPSDEGLRAYLITEKDFMGPEAADKCISSFRDTIEFAKLKEGEYINSRLEDDNGTESEKVLKNPRDTMELDRREKPLHAFSWPLSKGVSVEVRFRGGTVNSEHIETLREYLVLAKKAIEKEDQEDSG